MAFPENGEVRTASFMATCFACGCRYQPKHFFKGMSVVGASDHVCDPKKLKKREEQLRYEFDDDPAYCDCDDLDCTSLSTLNR